MGGLATEIAPFLSDEAKLALVQPAGDALSGALRLARLEAEQLVMTWCADSRHLAIGKKRRSDCHGAVSGALTVAIANATDSLLAATCDIVLPRGAGPELTVAATKTFVATASALLRRRPALRRRR